MTPRGFIKTHILTNSQKASPSYLEDSQPKVDLLCGWMSLNLAL